MDNNKRVSVFRKEHFNAAHRLFHPDWDDEKNREVFGKCSNPNYHGHNYELEIKVTGVPQADTGFVIDLKYLSDLTKKHVLEKLDHKNLNLDVTEFKNTNPTVEQIALVIYNILRKQLENDLNLQIRLYETPRNFSEYPAIER